MILDMCAAPGGKTTHLAALVKAQSDKDYHPTIFALDKSAKRLSQVMTNCQRLNCQGFVKCFVRDSTKCVDEALTFDGNLKLKGPPFPPESFDKILLDAPCSAIGQRPQFQNQMKLKEFLSFPKIQKKLFRNAVQLLKKGGLLVYSTCSPSLEENEVNS